jgi:hypothetical protein
MARLRRSWNFRFSAPISDRRPQAHRGVKVVQLFKVVVCATNGYF